MDCRTLTAAKLASLIKNELEVGEVKIIGEHFQGCPACLQKYQQAKALVAELGAQGTWKGVQEADFHYKEKGDSKVATEYNDEGSGESSITSNYLNSQETLQDEIIKQVKKAPWWLISLTLHGILIFLCTLIVIKKPPNDETTKKVIEADLPPKQEPEYDPEVKKTLVEEQKDIPKTDVTSTEKSEVVPMENVEVSDHFEAATDSDFQEMLDADPDNKLLADKSGDIGSFTGIGLGGGSGGAFGQRGRGGRKWLVKAGGGSEKSESAVSAALEWLRRHQEKEGWWSTQFWQDYCGNNPWAAKFPGKCMLTDKHDKLATVPVGCHDKREFNAYDGGIPANTGLAMLAFFGQGYTHKRGKYKDTLAKAVDFLIANESESAKEEADWVAAQRQKIKDNKGDERLPGLGKVGLSPYTRYGKFDSGYSTGPITLAMIEAYGVSRDPYLKPIAQRMATYCCAYQMTTEKGNPADHDGGFGGSMTPCPDMSGSSFPFMVVMDLKAVGLELDKEVWEYIAKKMSWNVPMPTNKQLVDKCMNYIKTCIRQNDGGTTFVYSPNAAATGFSYARSGIALFSMAKFSDYKKDAPEIRTVIDTYLNTDMYKKYKDATEFPYEEMIISEPDNAFGPEHGGGVSWYGIYYSTLALFQYANQEEWEQWNKMIGGMLLKAQGKYKELAADRKCMDGSWGRVDPHHARPYSTAIGALTLEVYYRYKKATDEREKAAKKAK